MESNELEVLDFRSQLKSGVKPLELVVFDPFGLMP